MKKIKCVLYIIFVFCITITMLSCNNPDNGGGSSNAADNSNESDKSNDSNNINIETETAEEEPEADAVSIVAGLPDVNYDGYEFRIWTSNWFNSTLEGRQAPEEEQNGEPINDALYVRDRLIEDKYNIKINYTILDPDPNEFASKASRAVKAGDDAFDFAMGDMMNVTKGLAQTGAIYDFNTIPNIDLTKPWWSKYAIRDLTINGRFFFPTGDISARFPGSQFVILFNKNLFRDMGIDYPYKTVLDGKWTLDAFKGIIKDKTRDLNGDGQIDKDDFYGYINCRSAYVLMQGCGEGLSKIVDGNPVLNVNNEKTISIIDELISFMGNQNYMYHSASYQTYDEIAFFKEDRAMFIPQTGTNISLYRDMESDFGILPLPKLNEAQEEYYSFCQPWGSVAVCVPQTNTNIERAGMIIEALAAAGRYTSTPAAYDVTLKTKYSRDDESEAMLDIIFEGSCYDFAYIYNWGNLYSEFINIVNNGENFISKYESIEGKALTELEKTINAFMGTE